MSFGAQLRRFLRQNAAAFLWIGLALLVLEGPLQRMPRETVLALGERLVVMVERGLS